MISLSYKPSGVPYWNWDFGVDSRIVVLTFEYVSELSESLIKKRMSLIPRVSDSVALRRTLRISTPGDVDPAGPETTL